MSTDPPPIEGPATLSGRPVVAAAVRSRTRVGRGVVVVSALFALAVVVAVAGVVLRAGPNGTDVRDMSPGDCYLESDVVDDHGRPIPYGRDTPCLTSTPRIVSVIDLPLGPFPGNDGLSRVVDDSCGGAAGLVILPTPESWLEGDRTVACIARPSG